MSGIHSWRQRPGSEAQSGGGLNTFMDSPIWAALSAAERSTVDSLIRQDHRIAAVARIAGPDPQFTALPRTTTHGSGHGSP